MCLKSKLYISTTQQGIKKLRFCSINRIFSEFFLGIWSHLFDFLQSCLSFGIFKPCSLLDLEQCVA